MWEVQSWYKTFPKKDCNAPNAALCEQLCWAQLLWIFDPNWLRFHAFAVWIVFPSFVCLPWCDECPICIKFFHCATSVQPLYKSSLKKDCSVDLTYWLRNSGLIRFNFFLLLTFGNNHCLVSTLRFELDWHLFQTTPTLFFGSDGIWRVCSDSLRLKCSVLKNEIQMMSAAAGGQENKLRGQLKHEKYYWRRCTQRMIAGEE